MFVILFQNGAKDDINSWESCNKRLKTTTDEKQKQRKYGSPKAQL